VEDKPIRHRQNIHIHKLSQLAASGHGWDYFLH